MYAVRGQYGSFTSLKPVVIGSVSPSIFLHQRHLSVIDLLCLSLYGSTCETNDYQERDLGNLKFRYVS